MDLLTAHRFATVRRACARCCTEKAGEPVDPTLFPKQRVRALEYNSTIVVSDPFGLVFNESELRG